MGILCDIDWINDIRHLLDAADPGTGCIGKVATLDVAVVIPTYNRAHLVGETLQSILSRTVTPHEIIVVNDGSQDETQAVLARFGQSIQCITIRNQGSVAARNVGLRAAGWRLVAFCDSDDLWREDFLERMLEVWQVRHRRSAHR
ncbi:MAG TPA: glycosyltransferase family A protein [Acetobacteraceae bacterium]|nr:glycosyltransferase family A protein [Acetobacteraceae bacterium]